MSEFCDFFPDDPECDGDVPVDGPGPIPIVDPDVDPDVDGDDDGEDADADMDDGERDWAPKPQNPKR